MTIETFRASLDATTLATVDALRAIVAAAGPNLSERIKWNAPSFAIGDDDRITLGLERKGGLRVVLHRGAKVRDSADFTFDDPTKLARWPAPDRGVVILADLTAVEAAADRLSDLCVRWLAATA